MIKEEQHDSWDFTAVFDRGAPLGDDPVLTSWQIIKTHVDWTAMRPLSDDLALASLRLKAAEQRLQERRTPPADVVRLLRELVGVDAVAGAADLRPTGRAPYPLPSLGSMSLLLDACMLDQRQAGSVSWLTEVVPPVPGDLVCFVFSLAMGNGSPVPEPTVTFAIDVEGLEIARFAVTKSARRWESAAGLLSFTPLRVEATTFGRSFAVDRLITQDCLVADGYAVLVLPRKNVVAGRPNLVTLRALSEQPSAHWCRIGSRTPILYGDTHLDALADALAPRKPKMLAQRRLLLGDLHSHSGESTLLGEFAEGEGASHACGVGSRRSLFEYSRDVAGLDFFCLSEHDWQMGERDWRDLKALNDAMLTDDFLTIHGYEWTSAAYGHRNVYFRSEPGAVFYSQDPRVEQNAILPGAPTPTDLWRHLSAQSLPAITIPHHMSSAQFPLDLSAFHDAEFDRVAEIYSTWGDSLEHGQPVTTGQARIASLALIETIREGRLEIGFIGSSDAHDGHPGNAQGTEDRPHLFHHLGSGRVGAVVDEATREGIFDAIHARRTFASTGDGLAAWTSLDDQPMGSAMHRSGSAAGRSWEFDLSIDSDAPLESLTVYRNGEASERIGLDGAQTVATSWSEPKDSDAPLRSIFIKVTRQDGEMAWTSPHWIR